MFEIENRTYFVQVLFNKKIFRVKFSCVFYFTYDFQFLKVFEEFYFFLCGFDWVLVGLLSVGKFDAFYPIVEWFLSFYIKFFYKYNMALSDIILRSVNKYCYMRIKKM